MQPFSGRVKGTRCMTVAQIFLNILVAGAAANRVCCELIGLAHGGQIIHVIHQSAEQEVISRIDCQG